MDLKTVLKIAEERNCIIPASSVYDMESVLGAVNTAKETGAPIIFQMCSRLSDHQNARYVVPVILKAMRESDTPTASHLDYGAGTAEVLRAFRHGATGIMTGASMFPPEENIETIRSVVEMCGACGVSVKGELGHVGTVRGVSMGEYTDVEGAKQFVRRTGVTALAIMMGAAHGRYKRMPVLDIGRTRDIKATTGVPLVLHGGSGVPDE